MKPIVAEGVDCNKHTIVCSEHTVQANRRSPVFPDLRNLVLKTTGLANVLSTAIQQPGIELAFVFGSLAWEDARPESDVDLMVIGAVGLRAATKLLSGVNETLRREINPHVLKTEEFAQRQRANDHFISSLLSSPRLFIIGSENELAELGRRGRAQGSAGLAAPKPPTFAPTGH